MQLGQQPHLKRKPRRVRSQGNEMVIFTDHSFASVALLPDNVAKDAPFFFVVVVPAVIHLLTHASWHDGQGDQLRMWMLDGSSRGLAMVLENQYVTKPLVVF